MSVFDTQNSLKAGLEEASLMKRQISSKTGNRNYQFYTKYTQNISVS